jgi:hypothetical protein
MSEVVKYSITNFISTKHLLDPLKAFANQISSANIPKRFDETLKDEFWIQAMKTGMKASEKNLT